jgi:toxin ParE1/3/4
VTRKVVTTPEAEGDLLRLHDHIEGRSGPARALAHAERIGRQCEGFSRFPDRGTRRDDARPGLRTAGFERRVTIAFAVVALDAARMLRTLCGDRGLEAAFDEERRPRASTRRR